ncbi:hypothetical protein LCGC14_3106050, partial [marine sediment metagenome]
VLTMIVNMQNGIKKPVNIAMVFALNVKVMSLNINVII